MPIRCDKAWCAFTRQDIDRVGGHLGVYQLADATHAIVYIGCADARSRLGLRGCLNDWLMGNREGRDKVKYFRTEVTSVYQTRWRELLMVYRFDHGRLPALNDTSDGDALGRLSPLPTPHSMTSS